MPPGSLAAATDASSVNAVKSRDKLVRPLVCHVASGDLWAGAESQLASLLRGLTRRGDFRLCAIFLNEARLADEVRQCGVDVKIIPETSNGFRRSVHEACAYLSEKGTGIIHSHGYKSNLLAAWVARRCQIPVVVRTQHGMPEPFAGIRAWKQGAVQLADRAIARWGTDGVIAVSEDMRVRLAVTLGSEKVIMVANGIDPNLVVSPWTSAEAKQRLGLSGDCPTVGTAGRLEPVKRLDLFLHMAAQISKSEPRCRFVIAGTGSRESDLRSLAGSLGLTDKVLFLGHRPDVWDVIRAMDMFVFSSDHEGLPMVLLEALALGVPVVARAVGGIPEVLEDGNSGILVQSSEPSQLAEACVALLAEPRRRQELAAEGMRRLASEYSLERTAASVSRFYTDLLGKTSRDSQYEADQKKTNPTSN